MRNEWLWGTLYDWLEYTKASPITSAGLKKVRHRLCILKKVAKLFQNRHFQSISIFYILSHPCSILFYNQPFGVFLPWKTIIFMFPNPEFNRNLGHRRNDSKYCDVAPLKIALLQGS